MSVDVITAMTTTQITDLKINVPPLSSWLFILAFFQSSYSFEPDSLQIIVTFH